MKIIICVYFLIVGAQSWDLFYLGINPNYYISSIAIYRSRAFLALPRSVCNNNVRNPTVVEVLWTGGYMPSLAVSSRNKILEDQKWKQCKDIQDAVSLDIEPSRLKLWILDKGSSYCNPKILSYNLIYNGIFDVKELENIPSHDLSFIKIDPKNDYLGCRIYIGNAAENTLLVFSTDNLKWWKIYLKAPSNFLSLSVKPDFLAISKTDSTLYITGKNSLELFSIDLEDIRNIEKLPFYQDTGIAIAVNTTLIGQKLGLSSGLETDFKSGLSYYILRDYVIARWSIGFPMVAEYHNILAQSYHKLPYVSQLFTGPQYGLWALVNPMSPEQCKELNTIKENIPKLENRVVKILKYNKFLNEIF